MMDFKKLEKDIHDNAIGHGWWETKRPIMEIFALIHSELSEALEAYRDGDHEHIGEELADVVIRILDFLGGLDAGLVINGAGLRDIPSRLGKVHRMVSDSMYAYPSKSGLRYALFQTVAEIITLAEDEGFDLAEEIRAKHERNIKRPYRHGGKAA